MYGCLSCSFFYYETPGFVLKKLTKEFLGFPSIMQLLICLALCCADNEIYHYQNSIYTQSLRDQIPADIVISDIHGAMPMILECLHAIPEQWGLYTIPCLDLYPINGSSHPLQSWF